MWSRDYDTAMVLLITAGVPRVELTQGDHGGFPARPRDSDYRDICVRLAQGLYR